MQINRDFYKKKLVKVAGNGLVKVITGIRRVGKSYLLFSIFREYLREIGVDDRHVIAVQLDDDEFAELRLPRNLSAWVKARLNVSEPTLARYLDHVCDSFLFNRTDRWDVKGNRYLTSPSKYYAVDSGLRNARINFRQVEMSHLMENAIYNELIRRGWRVDVGVVNSVEKDADGKSVKTQREIDFVVNAGMRKFYIQSALEIGTEDKFLQETASLKRTGDFFRKILVVGGNATPRLDNNGYIVVGVIPFLLDEAILDSTV